MKDFRCLFLSQQLSFRIFHGWNLFLKMPHCYKFFSPKLEIFNNFFKTGKLFKKTQPRIFGCRNQGLKIFFPFISDMETVFLAQNNQRPESVASKSDFNISSYYWQEVEKRFIPSCIFVCSGDTQPQSTQVLM